MEEIEIKIEYIDTFARDPLSFRSMQKRKLAEPPSHSDQDGDVACPPDNYEETAACSCSPVLAEMLPLTLASPLHASDDNQEHLKTLPPPLPTLSGNQEDIIASKQLCNTVASKNIVTWYRNIDKFGKLQCKYCDLSYMVLQTLRVHVKNKHPKEAATLQLAIKNSRNAPKLFCHLCNEIFQTQETLKQHINCKLNSLIQNTFICDYCTSVHRDRDEIIEHIHKAHKDRLGNFFKKIPRKVCEVRKFQCPYCAHFAKRRYGLTTHIRAKHKTEGDMKFACPHCTHRTSLKYYLQSHIASKHPESEYARSKQRYVCDICAYGTTRKSHFQQHRRNHFPGRREYKCEVCSYETNYAANLSVHKRIHTKEKPYKCDFEGCDYECSAKTALNSHKIKHDPECHVWYCDKCNYKTAYKSSLKKHVEIHNRREVCLN